jgi:signal transduction histidine kinase/CheY-like chemotaxis protein
MTIYLSIASLLYTIFLSFFYFRKKKIESEEIRIYSILIVITLISLVSELLIMLAMIVHSEFMGKILMRIFLCFVLVWTAVFFVYVFNVSHCKANEYLRKNFEDKKLRKIYIGVTTLLLLPILFLKILFYESGTIAYSYGPCVNYIFGVAAVYTTLIIIMVLSDIKNIASKQYIPVLSLIFLNVLSAIIQKTHPEFLMVNFTYSLTVFIMYNTIENPDMKMIEQLEIAKEQADKANNAKTDFLSNMSHEIRTPLNAIVGFSESLKDEQIPNSAREQVDDIIMASNNLLDIVNGILDISKIEANKLEIINKEYDIKSVLDELIALSKARIGDKGIDFRVNIDPTLPRVLYGDNVRLKQVILNILTNAIKYTKEGFVDFTVSSVIKDDICRLIVSVEDSGIGIKEESIPKLFSKFERLDVEKEITIEGTGLGLAITKKLIELMNGTIVVQSVYGKGSKFTVSIDQRIISVEPKEVVSSPFTESKIIDAHGARILVVDDNALNIKVASVLLNKYHFNIDEAGSGYECLNKINNGEKYDLIFLDDMMPKMSGKETLTKLRKMENFKTPVIVLTANAITGMKEEYLNAGFDDYLSKPIDKSELERVIKKYLNQINSRSTNTNYSSNPNSILQKTMAIELPKLINDVKKEEPVAEKAKKKVLLVDDNEVNLKVAQMNLKPLNFDVTSVTSGSSAIEHVIENKYDLILLDEMMPELDGCTTLDNLKTLEGFDTPVIMMTASSRDEIGNKLEEHGFAGYLSKPFKREDLEKIIYEILN